MTLPRRILINTAATPYYHCVSRCVRRAFLCGQDAVTGYDFEHRRGWIESRLQFLATIFAIDVCAYAVMSNHYHVVLHINKGEIESLDASEVIERWQMLHAIPDWFDHPDIDQKKVAKTITLWRERLTSISWFMKSLNEPLARMANKEDGCKGRFWEGRFKSQALLDEESVLKCMTYVDLNPIRAQLASTPEDSAYTSIKARIEVRADALAPMADAPCRGFKLPITNHDYLTLVEWTGRQLRSDKPGVIERTSPPIVDRLQGSARNWIEELSDLTRRYGGAIGNASSLLTYRDWLGQTRLNGLTTS